MSNVVKAGLIQMANKLDTSASCEEHRNAMIETKLKYRNQTADRANPASRSRSRCAATVSGTSTFSSAARLRLISSWL